MTIQELKEKNLILLECISGSRAYGLDTPESDTDIRGVFFLPKEKFLSLGYIDQVSNKSNDIVYYELGRFIELLSKNNPNILELLNTPEECILYKHPIMNRIRQERFLSKLCLQTFGNYAMTQIKKARGLNKKILNPVELKPKSILDFFYVIAGQGSVQVKDFLNQNNLKQEYCGLSKIPHMHDIYGIYYDASGNYKGMIQKESANDVALSSNAKGENPIAIMSFNQSGYSAYCREYKEYWDWVDERNETRYQNTLSHGKNYDAKNMMHTFRLLAMAEEIGRMCALHVKRPDRDFLLSIKQGEYNYEELVRKAEMKLSEIKSIYKAAPLPERPDMNLIERLLVELREDLYQL